MTAGARSIDGLLLIDMSKEARGVEAEFAFTDKRMRPEGLGPGPGPCKFNRGKEMATAPLERPAARLTRSNS